MIVAKHDGSEQFSIPFNFPGIANAEHVTIYHPVPGGVVMQIDSGNAVFVPTVRLVYDGIDEQGRAFGIRLESTMAQMMQVGAMLGAAMQQQMGSEEG